MDLPSSSPSSGLSRLLSTPSAMADHRAGLSLDVGRVSIWHAVLAALVTYRCISIIYNLFFHPLAKTPGPPTWSASRLPMFWSIIRGNLVLDVQKLHQAYGPVVRVAPNEVSFIDEGSWRDILTIRADVAGKQFLKDHVWWGNQPGLPDSIVTTIDPKRHTKVRQLLGPGFRVQAVRDQEPIAQRYVNLMLEKLAEKARQRPASDPYVEIDIVQWLNFVTFDIFGDLGFGESFNCVQNCEYHPWISFLFGAMKMAAFVAAARLYPLFAAALIKMIPPALQRVQRDHFQQIVDRVDRRLNLETQRPDIMSHVVESNGKHNVPLPEVNSTFMILTIAGSETTATTLSGTLNYLVNNPDKLACLQTEVRQFARLEDMTLEALKGLPYLNAVVDEGLRLCPPIPFILPRRVPRGGAMVCGRWLPEDTAVSIQPYVMNREPSNFHQPNAFVPERWLAPATSDPASPFFRDSRQVMQAFSVGPRACLGKELALAEMRLILSKLVWMFDLEVVEGKRVRWEELKTFVLIEKIPIPVRLKVRQF